MVNTKAPKDAQSRDKTATIPSNIMFDRRVVRGNTYAPRMITTERSSILKKHHPVTKHRSNEPHPERRLSWRRSGMTTPEPVDGRHHMDVQTDAYLEEVAAECSISEHSTQTDVFYQRPITPLFIPRKLGVDTSTQVELGETFDFDVEVEPILESILGKVLEQSSVEIVEALELEAMDLHRLEMQQRRAQDLTVTQEMEAVEKRRIEEIERRLKQEAERKEREMQIRKRIAAQTYARGYLNGIVKNVFHELEVKGYFHDPVEKEVENEFLPWLELSIERHVHRKRCVRRVIDWIVRSAINKQNIANTKALEAHKERVLTERREEEEKERWFREELAAKAAAILALTDPPLVSQEVVEKTKAALQNQTTTDKEDPEEEEDIEVSDEDLIFELIRTEAITKQDVITAMSVRSCIGFRVSRDFSLAPNCTSKRVGNLSNLEPWQKDRLEIAFISGKRKTKINELSNELGLSRKEVLTWFRDFQAIPKDVRSSLLESLEDRKKTDDEYQEHIDGVRLRKQEQRLSRARIKNEKEKQQWKPLNQAKLQALRKVREITPYPTDDMLNILYDFHRIPKRQAIEWFQKQRQNRR
eukprot:g7168.t1